MRHILFATAALLGAGLAHPALAQRIDAKTFASPPAQYRPTITLDEGSGYKGPLDVVAKRAIFELDAGGILINPQGDPSRKKPFDTAGLIKMPIGLLDRYPAHASPWLPKALPGEARFGSYLADGKAGPGEAPGLGYMTPQWFSAVQGVLDQARREGRYVTYYDEAGFPSGSADGTIPAKYYRKLIRREETTVSASQPYRLDLESAERPTAVVALNTANNERVDLLANAKGDRIDWVAPYGNWRVQRFYIATAAAKGMSPDYYATADYLDPEATQWFIKASYDRAHETLGKAFGETIKFTFFDDVGILMDEKTWNPAIATRFEALTGRPAALYYPALWADIGPDTVPARVGFFKARAEILGETFPKLITDWAHDHGVRSTGHAPGNYDLQPTDTIGDPFKFYGHTDVPMADVLWGVGFARSGFKLISSVSAERDLPLTAAEAFSIDNDANGYRRTIELFVRGFNHFVLGGREPSKPIGTGADLVRWTGRSAYLLQGGRHVADIAVMFPIESLQAFYSFNAPGNSADLPTGAYAYADADYQAVGEMLLSDLHRDFTFIHPDALAGDKLQVKGASLEMSNKINREQFKAVVLPGGEVISVAALAKIKAFWDAGGAVVATSKLPSRSAEFGQDAKIGAMVAAIFGGPDAAAGDVHRNAAGGRAVFLAKPSPESLAQALDALKLTPDVGFEGPIATKGIGVFGYTHRQRDGRDIYYFGNSSDGPVQTLVTVRGRLDKAAFWNPHDGKTTAISGLRHLEGPDGPRTQFSLRVEALSSLAVVGVQK
ncbi:glycosyl hydrolase [Caulobacter rhizosphaerae]|uniref:glycosyl hydrolase n=1 Tax=Caulobacter rhizosphaerae TaxID=2010972 RepID=UPI0013D5BA50|nr:glycosyl hydrolase [Caulobacter rhizosphaerae]GGL35075.1 hypothetical protein GCM10010983_35190 [Caulobacter rhizosphaerae]